MAEPFAGILYHPEMQYTVDMAQVAELLRIQLSMAQCLRSPDLRNAMEEEILMEYLAVVYTIWLAYKSKPTVLDGFIRRTDG